MKAIVQPAYEAFELLLPQISTCLDRCKSNLKMYESLIDEYEEKRKKGNNTGQILQEIEMEMAKSRL